MSNPECPVHPSAKLQKPPLKARKNCPRSRYTSYLLWGESLEDGEKQCFSWAGKLGLTASHWEGLGCHSTRAGWARENSSSAAVWIKISAAWKYMNGRDVEKSGYGLVKTQKVLWFLFFSCCCCFLKMDRKSLIMCLWSHCGFIKMRQTNIP